jgi:DNA-binding Lrp family transcriptional regulator
MKFTDEELIKFMKFFLKDNDQMPTQSVIADYFDVAANAVFERLRKLERDGVFERNEVNKIRFARGL